ncbi:MAG: hypothetical protein AB1758_09025 [Candidatus Eremiobacterota bacterium]
MKAALGPGLVGLVLGGALGWFYPDLHGLPQAPQEIRAVLSLKIGLVFGCLGAVLGLYGAARRRMVERIRRER